MYTVYLKKNEEKDIINKRYFIFSNEVLKIEGHDSQGSVCRILNSEKKFLGIGFINHLSKMIVKIISFSEETVNYSFFYERIKKANERRLSRFTRDSYRVVFSDSDFLPGLIVDKYDDHLVISISNLGMDLRKKLITDALINIFNPKCIYEKSLSTIREKEGLKLVSGLLYGELNPNLVISINNINYGVDIVNGQKTGYFLDQVDNRLEISKYAKDRNVLDLFCNVGGFSLVAAAHGAKKVYAVDISEIALEEVKKNALLNNISNIETINKDIFNYLTELKDRETKFDCIVLDPPAFIKTIDTIGKGYNGYLTINKNALKLLPENGILFTFSCSEHMSLDMFLKMINEASIAAKVNIKIIKILTQSEDHIINLRVENSFYLKGLIVQLIN
ncbi:MAG: class I SAM-dependent rRNA methyltransferase [Acholeplasmatales bacterium]|jgi:23S rRNA (cytosine1962-C5)-methyltransferase|nr:class I SAM-dependent rRNA methyltransferase [Acholeplasmatales bacterium]